MDKVIKIVPADEEITEEVIEHYRNMDPNDKLIELEQIREKYFDLIGLKKEDRRVKKVFEIADLK